MVDGQEIARPAYSLSNEAELAACPKKGSDPLRFISNGRKLACFSKGSAPFLGQAANTAFA